MTKANRRRRRTPCPCPSARRTPPGVPGPLCLGHPHHCQMLFDAAGRAGAVMLRGVDVTRVVAGAAPSVTYAHAGETRTVHARLVVGVDGRTSMVREAAAIVLHQDKPTTCSPACWWTASPAGRQASGRSARKANSASSRLSARRGPRPRLWQLPARTASPLRRAGLGRAPSWTPSAWAVRRPTAISPRERRPVRCSLTSMRHAGRRPFAEGVVLVGDAAGWNDPDRRPRPVDHLSRRPHGDRHPQGVRRLEPRRLRSGTRNAPSGCVACASRRRSPPASMPSSDRRRGRAVTASTSARPKTRCSPSTASPSWPDRRTCRPNSLPPNTAPASWRTRMSLTSLTSTHAGSRPGATRTSSALSASMPPTAVTSTRRCQGLTGHEALRA